MSERLGRLETLKIVARPLISLYWAADPLRAAAATGVDIVNPVLGVLSGLWLKFIVDGVLRGDARLAVLGASAEVVTVAIASAGNMVSFWCRFQLRALTQVRFIREVTGLTTSLPGIGQHEDPRFLDRLNALRGDGGQLAGTNTYLIGVVMLLVQVTITVILLAGVAPLLLLLPLFTIPSLLVTPRVQRIQRRMEEEVLPPLGRRDYWLFHIATAPESGAEVRIFGLGPELTRRGRALYDQISRESLVAQLKQNAMTSAGWLCFSAGYLAAIAVVVSRVAAHSSTPGDVMLVLTLAGQVQGHAVSIVGMVSDAQASLRAIGRYLWLHSLVRTVPKAAEPMPVPARIRDGIRFENVSFTYPGTEEPVISDVSIFLPAGSTIAFVGENGAGKSTLVKLLCRFYQPSSGRITLDGVDIERFDNEEWRQNMTATFQDFLSLHYLVRESVGLGDVPRIEDTIAVTTALEGARGSDMVARMPSGLETQLGRWMEGEELSGGQWQKLAIARSMMRERSLVQLLDEPTSAIDAPTEHAIFERYAGGATSTARELNGITVLVSHRFSTVRMADMIVVVAGGRVADVGTHEELMARGGEYAELFQLQARGYA